MEDEISFLKEMLDKWDKSIEMMNGTDAEIYRCIQDRFENLTKHNIRKPQSANHIHTFNDVRTNGNYCTTCGIPENKRAV